MLGAADHWENFSSSFWNGRGFFWNGKLFWKRQVSIGRWQFHRQSQWESGRHFLQSAGYWPNFQSGRVFPKGKVFWLRNYPQLAYKTQDPIYEKCPIYRSSEGKLTKQSQWSRFSLGPRLGNFTRSFQSTETTLQSASARYFPFALATHAVFPLSANPWIRIFSGRRPGLKWEFRSPELIFGKVMTSASSVSLFLRVHTKKRTGCR